MIIRYWMFFIANNIICRYIIYVTSIHNVRSTYTHAYIICSHTANRDVTRHPITLLLSSVCRRRTYAAWHSVQFRTPTEARVKFIFYVINYSNFFTTKILYEINFFRDLQVIANILNILVFFFVFFLNHVTQRNVESVLSLILRLTLQFYIVRKWVPTIDLQYY